MKPKRKARAPIDPALLQRLDAAMKRYKRARDAWDRARKAQTDPNDPEQGAAVASAWAVTMFYALGLADVALEINSRL